MPRRHSTNQYPLDDVATAPPLLQYNTQKHQNEQKRNLKQKQNILHKNKQQYWIDLLKNIVVVVLQSQNASANTKPQYWCI